MFLNASFYLVVGACSAFASDPGSFERTLAVSGPVRLDVRSDPGGVNIMAGSSTAVRVRALIKPLYGRLDLDVAETNIRALEKNPPIEQVGNSIRIGYVKDASLLRAVSIHFEIEVPLVTEVRVYTESGGIRIDGITGPAVATTVSGRTEISNVRSAIDANGHSGAIVIRNAGGRVSVRTESGGIWLSNIEGLVESETTTGRTEISGALDDLHSITHSGAISIDRVSGAVVARNHSGRIDALRLGGSVNAENKSGAIHISQLKPAPIRAVADSGAIKVNLASGGGYLIDAQSKSGKISGPVATTARRKIDGYTLQATIASGGPLVDIDTHSSKIDINWNRAGKGMQ